MEYKGNHFCTNVSFDRAIPYRHLFILAIDTLNFILDQVAKEGVLTPLKGRNAKLHLSLYADDTVIFTNPIKGDVRALFRILDHFGKAIGLKLNL